MNDAWETRVDPGATAQAARSGTISCPADRYRSPDVFDLEKRKLWPSVWQIACREEELPEVGSFVLYDILDESIVVTRSSATEIKAFYNVCQHRGRKLVDRAKGVQSQFYCRFHGWKYSLDGDLTDVYQAQDWSGCPAFDVKALSLQVASGRHLRRLGLDQHGSGREAAARVSRRGLRRARSLRLPRAAHEVVGVDRGAGQLEGRDGGLPRGLPLGGDPLDAPRLSADDGACGRPRRPRDVLHRRLGELLALQERDRRVAGDHQHAGVHLPARRSSSTRISGR